MGDNSLGKKVFFKTFGCKTNFFDTQVMMNRLKSFELSDDELDCDTVVINSCRQLQTEQTLQYGVT